MSRSITSGILSALTCLLAASALPARELSIDERVTAQKAIEQVYWNHRIWPKENPGPKPQLAAVMSDQAIRAKVDDYLRKSNALERFWQRPVTSEQLQAELDRMAKNTRDGATLQELFGALGNDPFVIAETLGRQTLVERLIRNWYANDARFHGDLKAKAEAALAACTGVDCMKAMGGEYRVAGAASEDAATDDLRNRRLGLDESLEAFVVTAFLEEREGVLETASVSWSKRSFDEWWRGERGGVGVDLEGALGTFTLPTAPLTPCTNDTWTPTRTEVPEPRDRHTSVWTGTEMIIWGSSFDNGATNLHGFNFANGNGSDPQDWDSSDPSDPRNAFTAANQAHALTAVDFTTLDVIGWDLKAAASIPEPGTYALMLAGLGLLGASARQRRNARRD